MKFGVVVKVSRRLVSFWYQTEGKRYSPLTFKGVSEVPLYFYVDNNEFSFGLLARDRFFSNDPHAFGNYFDIIKDPSKHFLIHNSPKRVKQLLYYGIEQYLSHFLNTVLYKSDSIESYRPTFPLKFIFDPDLGEPERNMIEQLFREAGYRTVSVVSYNEMLLEHLKATNFVEANQAVLLLTGLEDTLYLELYLKRAVRPVSTLMLENQGSDPRIRILAGMIIDYIAEQNPYLDLDLGREVNALLPYSAGLLSTASVIVTGDAELSNGSKCWFRINSKNVEDRLQFYAGDLIVSASINDLLKQSGVKSEELTVLLASDQIKTPYFSERLLKQYPQVKCVEAIHLDETMQLIFSKPSLTGSAGTLPPQLPEVPVKEIEKAEAAGPPPLPPKKQPSLVQPPPPPMPKLKHAGKQNADSNLKPVEVPKPPIPKVQPTEANKARTIIPPPLPPPKKTT